MRGEAAADLLAAATGTGVGAAARRAETGFVRPPTAPSTASLTETGAGAAAEGAAAEGAVWLGGASGSAEDTADTRTESEM